MKNSISKTFTQKNYPAVLVSGILSLIILVWFHEMWKADMYTVLYDGFYGGTGSTIEKMKIQNFLETGSRYVSDRLGLGSGHRIYALEQSDGLNYLFIRIFSLFTDSAALILNILFILTFPFGAMTATYALSRLSVSKRMSIFSGVLYTFIYYHFFYNQNSMTPASYYLVPLGCLISFYALRGDLSFSFSRKKSLRVNFHNNRLFIMSVITAFLLSSTGLDYGFFFCVMFLAALIKYFFEDRKWNKSMTGGVICLCATVFGFVLNFLPFILYRLSDHYQAMERIRERAAADHLGLKILTVLLPGVYHRWDFLRDISRKVHFQSPAAGENQAVGIGLFAVLGFLLLLFLPVLIRKGKISVKYKLLRDASYLMIIILLLGTMGGGGSITSWFLTDRIRAYNRVIVYIAFFAFLAISIGFDRIMFGEHAGNERLLKKNRFSDFIRKPHKWFSIMLAPLFILALYDQMPIDEHYNHMLDYEVRRNTRLDGESFFARIEDMVPEGAKIFQYPYIAYPEPGETYGFNPHIQQDAYLYSKTLKWSSGAPKGFKEAAEVEKISNMGVYDAILELRAQGYDGVVVYNNLNNQDRLVQERIGEYATLAPDTQISIDDNYTIFFIPLYDVRLE